MAAIAARVRQRAEEEARAKERAEAERELRHAFAMRSAMAAMMGLMVMVIMPYFYQGIVQVFQPLTRKPDGKSYGSQWVVCPYCSYQCFGHDGMPCPQCGRR
ncbi:MAG: hypothetical protein ACOC6S_03290 [Chloroflexota bacterium]